VKGIVHTPSESTRLKAANRDALLLAISNARRWVEDIKLGRVTSLAELARSQSKGERYVRMLMTLAFVSPRIVAAIIEGTVPADLTVSHLAKALPHSWTEQEHSIGLSQ
jgi:hypothetical protein